MIAAVQLKKYIVNTSIFDFVINKLSNLQELYLIILVKINKNSKLHFYNTILFFYLLISLRVKNNKKFLLNIKKVA